MYRLVPRKSEDRLTDIDLTKVLCGEYGLTKDQSYRVERGIEQAINNAMTAAANQDTLLIQERYASLEEYTNYLKTRAVSTTTYAELKQENREILIDEYCYKYGVGSEAELMEVISREDLQELM